MAERKRALAARGKSFSAVSFLCKEREKSEKEQRERIVGERKKRRMPFDWPDVKGMEGMKFVWKDSIDWGVDDVKNWLRSVGMSRYEGCFGAVDGCMLMQLGDSDLVVRGVVRVSHREYFLKLIECLVLSSFFFDNAFTEPSERTEESTLSSFCNEESEDQLESAWENEWAYADALREVVREQYGRCFEDRRPVVEKEAREVKKEKKDKKEKEKKVKKQKKEKKGKKEKKVKKEKGGGWGKEMKREGSAPLSSFASFRKECLTPTI